mmetsp:Transcript_15045/g.42686  ORF Transcript_15045/g.42686 Transcript_15045/m.42686 type:complete len:228 (+) Transcript_15045:309-992(+)
MIEVKSKLQYSDYIMVKWRRVVHHPSVRLQEGTASRESLRVVLHRMSCHFKLGLGPDADVLVAARFAALSVNCSNCHRVAAKRHVSSISPASSASARSAALCAARNRARWWALVPRMASAAALSRSRLPSSAVRLASSSLNRFGPSLILPGSPSPAASNARHCSPKLLGERANAVCIRLSQSSLQLGGRFWMCDTEANGSVVRREESESSCSPARLNVWSIPRSSTP